MDRPLPAPGGFPIVGIVGGGQLARMCAGPAVELGITLSVLAESTQAAAALAIPSAPVGAADDLEAVRAFARDCDVVTFDHEQVPQEVLAALVADGVVVHPSPEALVHAQDKLVMRDRLSQMGIPCPAWAQVDDVAALRAFGDAHGWPVVLKTPRGGYDGKGVRVVRAADEADDWFAHGEPLLAEESVDFVRELAVLVARSPSGQASVWPVVHTVQTDGICTSVVAPAADLDEDLAGELARTALRIAGELGVTGVMAVEVFELADGDGPAYVVNELAMRPHNSGHWTQDGSVTSQFEQHLRAVLDLPLGAVTPRSPWTVMTNVLGGDPERHGQLYPTYKHLMARDPALRIHLYGKSVRLGRKIGHVNTYGTDLADVSARGRHAADYLQGVIDE
ncbi:5-(carboxyamino)imidazole ribonucleotide synthase [Allobranchiibius sp. CTAmp26]|uniref:5-(carboxyamino)imidazole ribonucleotide synthase n=1 Tax=Allobranchiibius sp. CTAmp26 TaxID=2815214 RepID=UPI001AA0DCDB|nr:5-(carboxyamino)imidazole ribonucleotide synthase [Allobranchiibius sp. CTAmp26]MBO1755648.1 5-(carboxyamino)imidazole ribonucleotide synthase [Allobranchiibius sp. CTAmp26]